VSKFLIDLNWSAEEVRQFLGLGQRIE